MQHLHRLQVCHLLPLRRHRRLLHRHHRQIQPLRRPLVRPLWTEYRGLNPSRMSTKFQACKRRPLEIQQAESVRSVAEYWMMTVGVRSAKVTTVHGMKDLAAMMRARSGERGTVDATAVKKVTTDDEQGLQTVLAIEEGTVTVDIAIVMIPIVAIPIVASVIKRTMAKINWSVTVDAMVGVAEMWRITQSAVQVPKASWIYEIGVMVGRSRNLTMNPLQTERGPHQNWYVTEVLGLKSRPQRTSMWQAAKRQTVYRTPIPAELKQSNKNRPLISTTKLAIILETETLSRECMTTRVHHERAPSEPQALPMERMQSSPLLAKQQETRIQTRSHSREKRGLWISL
mmetsp:Transcript_3270/g.10007  ORF Transcript_3270/g.10007 Transcript_3270/m.10007 type:complete len:343 (+) Transcript_3270:598-1626(+)